MTNYAGNPLNLLPWTLALNSAGAVAVQPNAPSSGNQVANAFDLRDSNRFALQVVPGTTTGNAVIELRWSIDCQTFISLGSSYQLTIPAGSPSAPSGLIVTNATYPFLQVAVVTPNTTGTANLFLFPKE